MANRGNSKGNRLLTMPGMGSMGSMMTNAKKAEGGRQGGAEGGMKGAKTRRENKAAGKMQTRLARPL